MGNRELKLKCLEIFGSLGQAKEAYSWLTEIPNGFTKWTGGECPDAEARVDLLLFNGEVRLDQRAGTWGWWPKGGTLLLDDDIVAYRVVSAKAALSPTGRDAEVEALPPHQPANTRGEEEVHSQGAGETEAGPVPSSSERAEQLSPLIMSGMDGKLYAFDGKDWSEAESLDTTLPEAVERAEEDGWIEHDGGACPVAFNTIVEIIQAGEKWSPEKAQTYIWEGWGGIRYRVVESSGQESIQQGDKADDYKMLPRGVGCHCVYELQDDFGGRMCCGRDGVLYSLPDVTFESRSEAEGTTTPSDGEASNEQEQNLPDEDPPEPTPKLEAVE